MSMYRSYRRQKQELFFPYGQSVTATGLAHGNPFHFSMLLDPTGTFLGKHHVVEMFCLIYLQRLQQDYITIFLLPVKWVQKINSTKKTVKG